MSFGQESTSRILTTGTTRGAMRLLDGMGLTPFQEFTLPNGRRVDIVAFDKKGLLTMVEVKVREADFLGDQKWVDYLPYCHEFYFAVPAGFSNALLAPIQTDNPEVGIIAADRFDGDITKPATRKTIAAQRHKKLMISLAEQAVRRAERR